MTLPSDEVIGLRVRLSSRGPTLLLDLHRGRGPSASTWTWRLTGRPRSPSSPRRPTVSVRRGFPTRAAAVSDLCRLTGLSAEALSAPPSEGLPA